MDSQAANSQMHLGEAALEQTLVLNSRTLVLAVKAIHFLGLVMFRSEKKYILVTALYCCSLHGGEQFAC